jgi:DNA-directed RNA polymerase beta subunit
MKLIETSTTLYNINIDYSTELSKNKVLINGNLVSFSDSIPTFIKDFKECRRKGLISDNISAVSDFVNKEIRIYTDAGRCTRPLLVVSDGRLKLQPEHLKKVTTV